MPKPYDASWMSETPTTWYVTAKEVIELQMTDGLITTAAQAADALEARYYIRQDTDAWLVYDVKAEGFGRRIAPVRRFESETMDAAVMWCLAHISGGM